VKNGISPSRSESATLTHDIQPKPFFFALRTSDSNVIGSGSNENTCPDGPTRLAAKRE